MLVHGVERLVKFKDERFERYLDGYLRMLSFMKGFMGNADSQINEPGTSDEGVCLNVEMLQGTYF